MGKPTPEEEMRAFLLGEDRGTNAMRRVFSRIPSGPNCKICAVPFSGPGGVVLRHIGFGRFPGNPLLCNFCLKGLQKQGAQGAEIPVSLLFADIRGSTAIGERLSATEFHAFLDRFYRLSSDAVMASGGIVDKFVGDEVIGLFFSGVSGPQHTAAAIAAARQLSEQAALADATPSGPIPIGAAVHTGEAFVGSTATHDMVNDFTALGDVVNTTARLASEAAAGELLVSAEAVSAAGIEVGDLERRTLKVKGRNEPVDVAVLRRADVGSQPVSNGVPPA